MLYAVESLTNPRLRDEVGDIHLVSPEDRVYGDGGPGLWRHLPTRQPMVAVAVSIGTSGSATVLQK